MINVESMNLKELEKLIQQKRKQVLKNIMLRSNQDLITEFFKSLNSENTRKAYYSAINKFIKYIGNKNLQLVTKLDYDNYYNFLNDKSDIKKRTKVIQLAGVTSFYQYFIHKQDIDTQGSLNLHFIENPITNIRKKWKNDKEETLREILTNEEIREVLSELKIKDRRLYIMFYILADTSMRGNGLINIKIKNIFLNKRLIKTWDKGKLRTYVFGENLKEELENYLIIRKRMNLIHDNKEYLFSSRKGTKLSIPSFFSHVYPKIGKIIKRITEKKITAHDLRRSFKTNRTNLGQVREQVEALMNHKIGLDNAYNRPTESMFLSWFDSYEEI